ncbi:MAG TPA: HEAT repeat domain-containing protein [Gemmatimonadales bacterium]|jgi:HEAT repeat protein|nr:HEAT repeat domain-containing protein [Gemmatimonadales bacterium]
MLALVVIPLLSIVQVDLQAATAALKSADPAARTRAACDVRELGDAAHEVIPQLVDLLGDASPVDPAICHERTWRWNRNWGTEQDTTSPGEQAASALVSIGSAAYEPLTRALKGPVWVARGNAAWALGALGNHNAAPLLAVTLRDTEATVRRRGAWALGALDASESVPALIDALKDTDAGVREQVAWALGAIGDRRAVEPLMNALTDQAPPVREQAAWALGALGDGRAVPALTKALKDSEARVRRQAAWAIGAIGG